MIDDYRVLQLVRLDNILPFLRNLGWDIKVIDYRAIIKQTMHSRSKIIPLDRRFADYEEYLYEALVHIAKSTGTNIDTIINQISQNYIDKIRYMQLMDSNPYKTLSIDDQVQAIEGFRGLITSIALSVYSPAPFYIGKHPDRVSKFLSSITVRNDNTKAFVLDAYYECNLEELSQPAIDIDLTFQRTCTKKMQLALTSFRKAYFAFKHGADLSIFDEYVVDGVNANFCESLKILNLISRNEKAIFSVRKANRLPVKDEHFSIDFANAITTDIDYVIDYLSGKETIENYELTGHVIKLYKQEDDFTGEITVVTEISNKLRRIKCKLPPEYYDTAITAHRNGLEIYIKGDLFVAPKAANMYNINNVMINGEDENT